MTSMAGMGMGMIAGAGGIQDPSQGEMYQTVGEAFGKPRRPPPTSSNKRNRSTGAYPVSEFRLLQTVSARGISSERA